MRKNFIRSLAVLLVIFSLMGTTAYAESAAVIGNAVNLRSGPGLDYQVLDTLTGGTVVEVTSRSGSWCAVSYNGTTGYMSSGYLSTLSAYDQTAAVSSVNSYDSSYESSEGVGVIEFEGSGNSRASASVPAAVAQAQAAAGESAVVTLPASNAAAAAASASASVTLPAAAGDAADENEGSSVIVLSDGRTLSSGSGTKASAQTAAAVSNVGKSGTINSDFVCLRSGPSSSHSIISSYNKGKELVISGEPVGGWTPCVIDNRSGYIYTAYITLREQQSAPAAVQTAASNASAGTAAATTPLSSAPAAASSAVGNAYITGNNVRLRSGPSMSSAILGELFYGKVVTVTGSSGSWSAVTVNGQAGYVYSQYVKSSAQNTASAGGAQTGSSAAQSAPVVTVPSTGSATGKQIAEYALQFVGYRYQWGGMSPETGFDCSGFVKYVYSKFGYTLNRVAGDQASNGVPVDISALQPGDVLCFYSSANYIGHTGIYIGNNKFVHASTSTTGVIISELSGYYTDRGYVARRIV